VSIPLETDFCIAAVEEVLARHGMPEMFDTDQASQFKSTDFIKVLARRGIKISIGAKGTWRDNVFVERLWRTINTKRSARPPMPVPQTPRFQQALSGLLQQPTAPFIA